MTILSKDNIENGNQNGGYMLRKKMNRLLLSTLSTLSLIAPALASADCYDPCWENPYSECCCENYFIDIDYLYWKLEDSSKTVPLVIRGRPGATTQPLLGAEGTSVALGHKKLDKEWRSGARVNIGSWFDCDHCWGAQAGYFFLPTERGRHSVRTTGAAGTPVLAVPFFDVRTGTENSEAIAFPGVFQGLAVEKLSSKLQGAEFNLMYRPGYCCGSKLTGLLGFCYLNFQEALHFRTDSPFIPPLPTDVYQTRDKFDAKNNFYGGQLGVLWSYDYGNFQISAKGKIAFGRMEEKLIVDGSLLTNDYNNLGAAVRYAGGYFALPTNIGHHRKSKFAYVPEVDLNIGYTICGCMQIRVGYTFLYASEVLRACKQVRRGINPTQATTYTNNPPSTLQGKAAPKVRLKSDSLWVQGINAGITLPF